MPSPAMISVSAAELQWSNPVDLADTAPVNSVNLLIFGTAEGAITIMAASIPILRALIQPQVHQPREFVDENNYIDTPKDKIRSVEAKA
jgi:hypothetical protein